MSRSEYYTILKKAWEKVDKKNRKEIHAYNEYKRQLFKLVVREEA